MLEQFFDSPLRVQALRNGPSGALRHIRAAEHFIYWANKEGIPLGSLNEQVLPRFDDHLSQCQCPGYGHSQRLDLSCGARSFVGYVCSAGVGVARAAEPAAQDPVLLAAFYKWMRAHRGTADLTLYNYSGIANNPPGHREISNQASGTETVRR